MVPWRDYCLGIGVIHDGARLIRIMASHSANRVESNYLMDDINNLERRPGGMYRVHFLGSLVTEVTLKKQGQPNLREFTAHRTGNVLEWSLISLKIRWTINTSKSAGIDGLLAVLQQ